MAPTLTEGQILFVTEPQGIVRGDIALVRNPYVKGDKSLTISRCMAMPGDTIVIQAKKLYVNSRAQKHEFCQFNRKVMLLSPAEIHAARNIYGILPQGDPNVANILPVAEPLYRKILSDSILRHISTDIVSPELHDRNLFPFSSFLRWNRDYYGPIIVPKKGLTINLSISNIIYYKSLIVNFEGSVLEYRNGVCYIDGTAAEKYTFKRNYFFFLNDYRDDVADSRTFGPLPGQYIVSKYVRNLGIKRD